MQDVGIWSIIPPVVAILLAVLTKEVIFSLMCGILAGAAIYVLSCQLPLVEIISTTVNVMGSKLSDNINMILFLSLLGGLVAVITKAGGSNAYAAWAQKTFKSRRAALSATAVFSAFLFLDDYFNCITSGTVMRPVTDANKVSRAKLAYLIDATAAPICMIAPISSWAAAVSDYTSGVTNAAGEPISSLALFCRAIPYNFYSLLTLVFIVALALMKFDYGPMRIHEQNAERGDLFTSGGPVITETESIHGSERGRVVDLVLPIAVLIVSSVLALLYVGGFYTAGDTFGDFVGAFGNTDATVGLPLGGIVALLITVVYMLCRRLISFRDAMDCIPKGLTAMVPAILILTMATALKNMTGLLGSDLFVSTALADAGALHNFLPAIIFVVACAISFSTGTSWGTFGILIPIVLDVFPAGSELAVIGMSACLAGSVCGDHCSPISDTTIMSSAGAQCEHVNHVSTQLPYALTVAAVSFAAYLLTGFVQNWLITLPIAIAMMLATLFVLRGVISRKAA